jgi:GntR family transcriptional repressor for pyruvate dehydrogenase complex
MQPDATFQPVSTTRAYVQIARQIAEAIRQDVYRPGNKLPPEHALAERLRVSRASVREALSALEIIGLVESKAGDGTYIRRHPSEISALNSVIEDLAERDQSPREVLEAREVMEPAAAAFAAERATPGNLQRMDAALAAMHEAIAGELSFVSADVEFHKAVAAASGNNELAQDITSLVDVMHSELWYHFNARMHRTPGQLERLHGEHLIVLKAIQSKDPVGAADAMRRHLGEATRHFFAE